MAAYAVGTCVFARVRKNRGRASKIRAMETREVRANQPLGVGTTNSLTFGGVRGTAVWYAIFAFLLFGSFIFCLGIGFCFEYLFFLILNKSFSQMHIRD